MVRTTGKNVGTIMPRQPTAVFAKTDRKCSNRTEALHHPTVAASGGSATGQQRSIAAPRGGPPLIVQARTSGRLGRGPWGERDREKRLCHGWCHGLLAVPSLTRRSPEAPTPRGLIGSHRGVYATGDPQGQAPRHAVRACESLSGAARHGFSPAQATRLPSRSRRPCSHGDGRPTGGTALGRTAARV